MKDIFDSFKKLPDYQSVLLYPFIEDTNNKVATLGALWVDEAFRREGIATKLVEQIEEIARKKGCKEIYGYTYKENISVFFELVKTRNQFPEYISKDNKQFIFAEFFK